MKAFLHNGEPQNGCPAKIKACTVDRTYNESKKVFDYGIFFEQAIGIGSAYSNEDIKLEKKALTAKQKKDALEAGIPESELKYIGEPYIDEVRLLNQAAKFREISPYYGIKIDDCQKKIERVWHLSEEAGSDIEIVLATTYDIRSPYFDLSKNVDVYYEDSIIDIKTCGNIYNEDPKNKWSWKFPQNMDVCQAKLTHYITGLPFIYFVFDYSADENYLPFIVNIDDNHMHAFNQDILTTVKMYIDYEINGWKENPSEQNCKTCPLKQNCTKKAMVKESVIFYPSH